MSFIIWGRNMLEEAVKSGRTLEKVYLQYGHYFEPRFLNWLKEKGIKFQWTKKQQLERLAKTKKHQGIVAILSPIEYISCEELFKSTIEKESFFVVLDRVTEPQNLGAIARTVESFGGVGILLPEKNSAPINEIALKASSGALFHLMVSRVPSLNESLITFKKLGGSIYAVETGGKDIRNTNFQKPLGLILGSEGKGIEKSLLKLSNEIVSIPTVGKTPSLNVSVAAGIAIWSMFT
ncbi:23S rRNA (guanosine(2251)-2'-O)-methyltransferase RlmB [Desulfurobacterium thermolithotrophum]|uniref:23S rRNA (guanosine(2251)-2'-O)-methyltransferase RlmB n=1 Tax=Desulfurobacterium thermolithotrophum TaxID=64160 RepID=UPI0013D6B603|nr:23S rRNA (guanosine(2251)-2'-O)-methyltransferase RlmB [Desulfurobacterium thermolithotrophum]